MSGAWSESIIDVEGERLMNMIEALIKTGAEVLVGPKRVHVISRSEDGFTKLYFARPDWEKYVTSGRKQPHHTELLCRTRRGVAGRPKRPAQGKQMGV